MSFEVIVIDKGVLLEAPQPPICPQNDPLPPMTELECVKRAVMELEKPMLYELGEDK